MAKFLILGLFVMGLHSFSEAAPIAKDFQPGDIISGHTGEVLVLDDVVSQVQSGDVVVLGEIHGQSVIADQHMQLLQALRDRGLLVNVGFEFFDITQQPALTSYNTGEISEEDFLKQVNWKGFPFDDYRNQALFPQWNLNEQALALNAPRSITSKIARGGLDSLTPDERDHLPYDFSRGSQQYFERFKEAIGHVGSDEAMERYFLAQSAWDDTMAHSAADFMSFGEGVLVIIVGEFHVQYGGGLPDRLRARGVDRIWTISQVNIQGLSPVEQAKEILPSPKWGPRADFVWTSAVSVSQP
ncbi:MAG: ChaN family lipoprotein [Pseudobdellovibrionaceae bacterium]